MSDNYKSDYNLRDQLVSACRGVPECKSVTIKLNSTFESVVSELRSAIGAELRCRQPNQYMTDDNSLDSIETDQFWTDRRYNGNGNRYGNNKDGNRYGNSNRYGNRDGNGYSSNNRYGSNGRGQHQKRFQKSKKCFVYGKQGCWSTKHTIDERRKKQESWRRYAQATGKSTSRDDFEMFLVDFEGIDIDSGGYDDEQHNNFETWLKTHDTNRQHWTEHDTDQQHWTQYPTTYGTIDGPRTVSILTEQAALHAFSKSDQFQPTHNTHNIHGTPVTQFFLDRYSSIIFQGIMPDTGAAGVSTAGEGQFRALQQIMPITLDTSTAGQHRVRFGDNPDCLLTGITSVDTPFGTIFFQVMQTNTPFLFCLADMDRHRVYLDNIRDVLVQGNKEYPIVRK